MSKVKCPFVSAKQENRYFTGVVNSGSICQDINEQKVFPKTSTQQDKEDLHIWSSLVSLQA